MGLGTVREKPTLGIPVANLRLLLLPFLLLVLPLIITCTVCDVHALGPPTIVVCCCCCHSSRCCQCCSHCCHCIHLWCLCSPPAIHHPLFTFCCLPFVSTYWLLFLCFDHACWPLFLSVSAMLSVYI